MVMLPIIIANLVRLAALLATIVLPIVLNANQQVGMITSCLPPPTAVLLSVQTDTMEIPQITLATLAYIIL